MRQKEGELQFDTQENRGGGNGGGGRFLCARTQPTTPLLRAEPLRSTGTALPSFLRPATPTATNLLQRSLVCPRISSRERVPVRKGRKRGSGGLRLPTPSVQRKLRLRTRLAALELVRE